MFYAELSLFGSFMVKRIAEIKLNIWFRQSLGLYLIQIVNVIQFIGENMVEFWMFEYIAFLFEPVLTLFQIIE